MGRFPSPGAEKAHGRVEQRSIEAVAEAAGIKDAWPAECPSCRVCRSRQVKKGTWQETKETVYLTGYRPPALPVILQANRGPFGQGNHASSVMSRTS